MTCSRLVVGNYSMEQSQRAFTRFMTFFCLTAVVQLSCNNADLVRNSGTSLKMSNNTASQVHPARLQITRDLLLHDS
jgi:hypothetical protein